MYSFFPGQVRVVQVDSKFEILLNVGPSRIQVNTVITLPSGFPEVPPVVTISPGVAQRWVSQDMRVVGHEALAAWHRNFSLGKVIKDIEIEFNLRPPIIIASPEPASVALVPSEQLVFPKVDLFSAKQLKELLEKEEKLADFFYDTDMVNDARAVQNELMQGNLDLASTKILALMLISRKKSFY